MCLVFRPTLLQQPDEVARLPVYKQVMMGYGKRALAAAALRVLECVSALHGLMTGGSHTRWSGIIVPLFEAAVPLVCLCADPDFPGDSPVQVQHGRSLHDGLQGRGGGKTGLLEERIGRVTRDECIRAAREALSKLEMLGEVSELAEGGARTLARLIRRVEGVSPLSASHGGGGKVGDAGTSHMGGGEGAAPGGGELEAWGLDPLPICDAGGTANCSQELPLLWGGESGVVSPDWAELLKDLTDSFGVPGEDMARIQE
jgi:hypothetical protein